MAGSEDPDTIFDGMANVMMPQSNYYCSFVSIIETANPHRYASYNRISTEMV